LSLGPSIKWQYQHDIVGALRESIIASRMRMLMMPVSMVSFESHKS
jgi:hypothetical protein